MGLPRLYLGTDVPAAELIRSIWIDCSMNSSTGNPVRRVEYPGCVLVHYVMSTVWNSLRAMRGLDALRTSQIFKAGAAPRDGTDAVMGEIKMGELGVSVEIDGQPSSL